MKLRKIQIFALLFAGAVFFLPIAPIHAKADNAWETISSYTTYYSEADIGRVNNIARATARINGITVQPYGEFSFNKTVGKRTIEAGYQQAKVIVNGEYVQGVGGGVCQVSTTLYNATVKSGLVIEEYHPHSLQVGYVAPSRDAMVSAECDFRFFNPYDFPVRLSATTQKGGLKVTVSGQKVAYRYEITSAILEEISPPPPQIVEGEKEEIVRSPKRGVKSEAYLEKYLGNALLERKRLRTDEYRAIQGIIVKKIENTQNKMPSNRCVFSQKML